MSENQFLTGLLYIDEKKKDFKTILNMIDEPLSDLKESALRPTKETLDQIMSDLM